MYRSARPGDSRGRPPRRSECCVSAPDSRETLAPLTNVVVSGGAVAFLRAHGDAESDGIRSSQTAGRCHAEAGRGPETGRRAGSTPHPATRCVLYSSLVLTVYR